MVKDDWNPQNRIRPRPTESTLSLPDSGGQTLSYRLDPRLPCDPVTLFTQLGGVASEWGIKRPGSISPPTGPKILLSHTRGLTGGVLQTKSDTHDFPSLPWWTRVYQVSVCGLAGILSKSPLSSESLDSVGGFSLRLPRPTVFPTHFPPRTEPDRTYSKVETEVPDILYLNLLQRRGDTRRQSD